MPKRSKVKLYEQIRKAHEREGLSVRELSRRFGVHRRDVRQALTSAVPPERKRPERPATVLDRWKPTIDGWLEADRTAPRKQRHTALSHPRFDAVLVPWPSGPEKETVCHGSSPEVLR